MLFGRQKTRMIEPADALPGRDEPMPVSGRHHAGAASYVPPFPEGSRTVVLGLGCFWGAERIFWQTDGVLTTAVGYAGGYTPNPTYEEVCSGRTGHAEVVLVVYDPARIDLEGVLRVFWEGHDPTQGMRQGNDVGTQYRSTIYVSDPSELPVAEAGRDRYQQRLHQAGFGDITTEIRVLDLDRFFYAEEYHQQYLSKNPMGYCGIGGTGVACPVGLEA